jgi:hypothetical protein
VCGPPEDSRDAIIARAHQELGPGEAFTIVEANKETLRPLEFDGDDLMERFDEHNETCWGEDGMDEAVPHDAVAELVADLNRAAKAWLDRHRADIKVWCFGDQRNEETLETPLPTMEEAQAQLAKEREKLATLPELSPMRFSLKGPPAEIKRLEGLVAKIIAAETVEATS